MKLLKSKGDIVQGVSEEKFLRAARRYVETAYPNPDRFGCPGRRRLEGLAHRKCPPAEHMDDIEHVATCSPCFVEYQAIRTGWKRRQAILYWGGAVAVILLFAGLALVTRHFAVPKGSIETANGPIHERMIDLRPYETLRGDGSQGRNPGPLILERAKLNLRVLLPIGSVEGRYVFKLLDPAGAPRLETAGDGVIRDGITTVQAPFDLRSMRPGMFTLTVRRAAAFATTTYRAEIR